MRSKKDLGRYRRRRRALHELQEQRCYLCDRVFARARKLWATFDHVTPKALGGKWGGNVVLAHQVCNHEKGDRAPRPCELLYLAAINERLATL